MVGFIFALALVLPVVAVGFVVVKGRFGNVLSQVTLADGTELRLVRTVGEPLAVHLYLRRRGENWGWCYVEHEALLWSDARLEYNDSNKSVQIRRGKQLVGEYFVEEKTYARYDPWNWKVAAPQEYHDPPP